MPPVTAWLRSPAIARSSGSSADPFKIVPQALLLLPVACKTIPRNDENVSTGIMLSPYRDQRLDRHDRVQRWQPAHLRCLGLNGAGTVWLCIEIGGVVAKVRFGVGSRFVCHVLGPTTRLAEFGFGVAIKLVDFVQRDPAGGVESGPSPYDSHFQPSCWAAVGTPQASVRELAAGLRRRYFGRLYVHSSTVGWPFVAKAAVRKVDLVEPG